MIKLFYIQEKIQNKGEIGNKENIIKKMNFVILKNNQKDLQTNKRENMNQVINEIYSFGDDY